MAKLYIAIYRATRGNFRHWALYLRQGNSHTILQVTGSHPNFVKEVINRIPANSSTHDVDIQVADINDVDVESLLEHADEVEVDNETIHWTCQDYILEILEKLSEECIIDEEDEYYEKGVRRAKKNYYGPM